MVLKLILKLVVIFSLINSIQCVCRGSGAIIDDIYELESRLLDAIGGLNEKVQDIENRHNCTMPIGGGMYTQLVKCIIY